MPVIVDLADMLAGLVRALFVFAARTLISTIVRGIGNSIPLVGGALSAAADDIADAISSLMHDLIGTTPDTTSGIVLTPALVIGELMSATITAVANLATASAHTELALIPRRELATLNTARGWVDTVSSTLARDVVVLRSYAAALSAADIAYTSAGLAEANAYTTVTGVRDVALTEATGVADRSYATALSAANTAYTSAVQTELVAYIGQVDHEITVWTTARIDQVLTYIEQVRGYLVTVVQREIAVVRQEITLTRVELETELIPRIDAVQTEITTLRETCIDDLCANQNERGKQLKNLDSIWSVALLLAYAAAAVADPAGTARATNDVVGPPLSGLLDAVVAVTGPAAGTGKG